ncbi:hypothetical protein [Pseudohoeflea coraliihabitans]|uniref:GT-D fold-like domain-containing protein n=1 Tax=Pseudohoeflea coraliihabitans TaxID=2860393 RepID=A0ABS6WLR5_9HYPH|nr:hypothetical protein [Pseudohoeflea sp. DP4N28-3]MBW3096891.1 hypothetical protein [Pseudohoeflea sp. DP4N28-3]
MGQKLLGSIEVLTRINNAVDEGNAFSLLRLGDGEGALLAFTASSPKPDLDYLRQHFGPHATVTQILQAQGRLRASIAAADILGIRDDVWNAAPEADRLDPESDGFFSEFKRIFPLRPVERDRLPEHGARRIFFLRQWLADQSRGELPDVCSAWIHADLQLLDYWEGLLSRLSTIGLIHNSASLAERLAHRFGVKVDFIAVPKMAIELSGKAGVQSVMYHTDCVPNIDAKIAARLQGKVFLVAAGLVGKHYCRLIKERGGIALDIGAVADAWDGKSSRGLVYADKCPLTASQYGAPPEMQLGVRRSATPKSAGKRIILHIGLSRTATTSIQNTLRANAPRLENAGVCYLAAGRHRGTSKNHHELATVFGSGRRLLDQQAIPPDLCELRRLLDDAASEIERTEAELFLFSSELFSNFSPCRDSEDILVRWLADRDAYVLISLRNQFDWLVSWHRQAGRAGNTPLFLDEFLRDSSKLPNSERFDGNFLRKARRYEKWVGADRLILRSYDEDRKNAGVINGFIQALNPARPLQLPDATDNVGFTSVRPELVLRKIIDRRRACNMPLEPAAAAIADLHPSDPVLEELLDRAFLTGAYASRKDELRQMIRDRYALTNTALADQYRLQIAI